MTDDNSFFLFKVFKYKYFVFTSTLKRKLKLKYFSKNTVKVE